MTSTRTKAAPEGRQAPRIAETAVVSADARIGDGTRVWHHAQVREGARIGSECNVGKGVYVGAGVVVGNPAKQIGWICACGRERFTSPPAPGSELRCERCRISRQ